MRQILIRLSLAGLSAVLGAPSRADEFKAPPIKRGAAVSIQGYGTQNPACMAWTNGCVLCKTGETGHSLCSVTGIACQPAGITCKAVRPK